MKDIFAALRPKVNENIKKAIAAGDLNAKVMPGDHVVTKAERAKYVVTYDLEKKTLRSKIKRFFANIAVNKKTRAISKYIDIEGLDNAISLKGKAFIITSNHYSPYDNLIIRHLTNKLGYKNKLSIIINESNLFMPGKLGKLVRTVDVLPYAQDLEYLSKKFNKALTKTLNKKRVVLIYPEQEMWLDYPYPRPLKPGAYHYASKFEVPLLPIFVTWKKDKEGVTRYIINIGKPIYSDNRLGLTANKNNMLKADETFKKSVAPR
ncbi:MAG: 1-acyl-sn-glycerol-3-phosphate acyltransferase [Bacilli bacterium]|jgi:1-acyl-sn-glycerol-3-phosphate acyltransferase